LQEQAEPRETPEGMIKLTPYAYLRFWLCLRGKIEHKPKEVNDSMRTGTTIRAVTTLLLIILAMAASTVHAIPWSDCHGIDPFEEEAELVADYTDADYSHSTSTTGIKTIFWIIACPTQTSGTSPDMEVRHYRVRTT